MNHLKTIYLKNLLDSHSTSSNISAYDQNTINAFDAAETQSQSGRNAEIRLDSVKDVIIAELRKV